MSRTADSLLHELDYWRALLDDVRELSGHVDAAAAELVRAPVELVTLAFRAQGAVELERAGTAIEQTMHRLTDMQAPLDRIVALVGGRMRALDVEPIESRDERP